MQEGAANIFAHVSIETILFTSIIAIVIAAFYIYLIAPLSYYDKLGIKGPKPQFFFGSMREISRLGGAHLAHTEFVQRFGRVCGMLYGRCPVILVEDPELIKIITVKEFQKFTNRRLFLPAIGIMRYSLLRLQDAKWKKVRSILAPTFTAAKLKQIVPIVNHHTDILKDKLINAADQNESVNVARWFGQLTMDVILSAAFGIESHSQRGINDLSEAAMAMFRVPRLSIAISLLCPLLCPIVNPFLNYKVSNAINRLTNVSLKVIEERQRNSPKHSQLKDLLHLMIEANENGDLSNEEIVAQSLVFLLAGYETTSTALSYVAYLLANHSDVQQKLIEEIDQHCPYEDSLTYSKVFDLNYLDMVFSESLRLYPPGYVFHRLASDNCTIGEITIPKGAMIAVPVYALHYDEKYWSNPKEFIPERFTPENKATRNPFCYLPFGEGPRSCIGMRFALLEAKLALVKMLQHITFTVVKDTEIPLHLTSSLTLYATHDVILGIRKRAK